MRRIVHVNVRLSEGGAAGVALSLHNQAQGDGYHSDFVYGYGPNGLKSPKEVEVGATRLTPRVAAAVSRGNHAILGRDLGPPPLTHAWRHFKSLVASSDIVHLHVVHSYFVDFTRLVELLVAEGKPVVWTMHDEWLLTGRCALPRGCARWQTGCRVCPDLKAYPPALVDRADVNWDRKRELVAKLQRHNKVAIIACASWLADKISSAGFANTAHIPNSVDAQFWSSARLDRRPASRHHGAQKVIFICRDLRDSQKVDWDLLNQIATNPDLELTIVGNNPPEDKVPGGAKQLPAVSDRTQLAKLLQQHDYLVFASRVDYYPLTIAESIVTGTPVVAIDSPAAREFDVEPGVGLYKTAEEAVALLRKPAPVFDHIDKARWDPTVMYRAYLDVYGQLW